MPDLQFGSFQNLGVPFTMDIEAEPGAFYQMGFAANPVPLDIGNTGSWQMLLMLNINNYKVLNEGFVDGVTGQKQLNLALPADAIFLGLAIPVQTWSIAVLPTFSVRFSNMRAVVGMP